MKLHRGPGSAMAPRRWGYTCPVRSNSIAQRRGGHARQRMRPHNRPARVVDEGATLLSHGPPARARTEASGGDRGEERRVLRGLGSAESVGSKGRQANLDSADRYATQKVRCALTLLVARRRLARALPPLAPSRCRLAPAPTPPGPTPSSSSASLFLGRSARPTSHAPSHALSEERSPERAPQLAPPPPSRRATPSRRSFAPGHPFNVMAASVELPCFRAAYGLTLHAKAAPVPRVETGRRVLAAWRYMHMSVE